MANPRFFDNSGPLSLTDLADIAKAEIHRGDAQGSFQDVQPLQKATAHDISFLENKLYVKAYETSKAGACLIEPAFIERAPNTMALLVTDEPYRAYARVAQAFYPSSCFPKVNMMSIHKNADIDPSARIGNNCTIDSGVRIEANVEIGSGCSIGANTTLKQGVSIGESCHIGENTTVQFATIGNGCVLHAGVRIGQDGFGFAPGTEHLKVPQLGGVRIGDNVDIGANTCIDRGAGPDTVIGDGTKIDNLVQIGHNVEIGAGCLLAAMSGVSGSTKVGNYVMIGGAASIAGHLTIGNGAKIAGRSGVMRDIASGETVAGYPAFPAKEYWRQVAALKRLTKSNKGA